MDAPVSGGNAGAQAGTLTVMSGATPAAFAISEPLFAAYGSLVVRVGDAGAGQMAKLINNMLMAANAAVGHTALNTAETLGLDREALIGIVNASSGRSFGFQALAPQAALPVSPVVRACWLGDTALLESCVPDLDPIRPFLHLTRAFLEISRSAK